MEPRNVSLSLTLKIRGHGCQCSQSGSKMKRLEVFSLSLWFQNISIVSWLRRWPQAVLQYVAVPKFKKSRVREDVTWPTSVGLS